MFYCVNIKKLLKMIIKIFVFILFVRFIFTAYFNRPYHNDVKKYSQEYDVEETLVYAVMFIESKFDKDAMSYKEAKGLMQIADITGTWAAEVLNIEEFETKDLFNPEINIRIGCWYLDSLSKQFANETAVLAAYNAGSGNVSKWLEDEQYSRDGKTFIKDEVIPFAETQKYVKKVKLVKFIYDILYW